MTALCRRCCRSEGQPTDVQPVAVVVAVVAAVTVWTRSDANKSGRQAEGG